MKLVFRHDLISKYIALCCIRVDSANSILPLFSFVFFLPTTRDTIGMSRPFRPSSRPHHYVCQRTNVHPAYCVHACVDLERKKLCVAIRWSNKTDTFVMPASSKDNQMIILGLAGGAVAAAGLLYVAFSRNDDASKEKSSLHGRIEELDKKGKAYLKNKQFLEAAQAFTDALTLIESETDHSDPKKSSSLNKQIVTLINNRSAMYEKANLPELALEDCAKILEVYDMVHTKARTRKLRLLENSN
eukprot:scaffold13018_cov65-Cylindrotheca_fusiformis.AAC.1